MGLTIFFILLFAAVTIAITDYLRGHARQEYQVHLLFALQIMVVMFVIAAFVFLKHHK